MRSGCFMRPACASASSPQPQKKSARTGPTMARAGVLRHHGALQRARRQRLGGVQPHRRCRSGTDAGSTAIERPGVSGAPWRAARAHARVGQRLLAEPHHARVGPQQLLQPLRVAPRPVLDRRPRGLGQLAARPGRPASGRPTGTAARCCRRRPGARRGRCRRPRRRAAGPSPAPAAAARRADRPPRRSRGRAPRPAPRAAVSISWRVQRRLVRHEAGRRPPQRRAERAARLAARLDQRLEVAGGQAGGLAFGRLEPEHLQALLEPAAGVGVVARREAQRLAAQRDPARRRHGAALAQRGPQLQRAVVAPAGQLGERGGHPARVRVLGLAGAAAAAAAAAARAAGPTAAGAAPPTLRDLDRHGARAGRRTSRPPASLESTPGQRLRNEISWAGLCSRHCSRWP